MQPQLPEKSVLFQSTLLMFSLKQFWLECWPTWKRMPLPAVWISCFNVLIYSSFLFYYRWYVISYLKASCGLRNSRQEHWLDWYHLWKHPIRRSKDQTHWFPSMHTLQGKWPANVLFHLPKFPKSNMPHAHGLLLEGEPPIPSVVLIKRTIMLLEMVVCLLVVPCYPHQSWSNTIYSCVCDVFTSTHSHVCVCRGQK